MFFWIEFFSRRSSAANPMSFEGVNSLNSQAKNTAWRKGNNQCEHVIIKALALATHLQIQYIDLFSQRTVQDPSVSLFQ